MAGGAWARGKRGSRVTSCPPRVSAERHGTPVGAHLAAGLEEAAWLGGAWPWARRSVGQDRQARLFTAGVPAPQTASWPWDVAAMVVQGPRGMAGGRGPGRSRGTKSPSSCRSCPSHGSPGTGRGVGAAAACLSPGCGRVGRIEQQGPLAERGRVATGDPAWRATPQWPRLAGGEAEPCRPPPPSRTGGDRALSGGSPPPSSPGSCFRSAAPQGLPQPMLGARGQRPHHLPPKVRRGGFRPAAHGGQGWGDPFL